MRDFLILDRVVPVASGHEVGVGPGIGQQCRHMGQVVEVGLCRLALASLMGVTACRV
jgi:hypothetical protein